MARLTLPEETFRIRPWRDSDLWFLVHVAPNVVTMRRELRAFLGECHSAQLAAVVSCEPNDPAARRSRVRHMVGVIFFARTWLGSGIVAHELSHAAFRVCNRLGIRVDHWSDPSRTLAEQRPMWEASAEEKYCGFAEHLTRDFWRAAYGRRLVS